MVKGFCERCSKEKKYRFPSQVKRFCSYACSNAQKWDSRTRGDRAVVTCEVCAKTFDLLKSVLAVRERSGPVRFCSKSCMGQANRKPESHARMSCDSCGSLFEKRNDHIAEKNYCSKECVSESRRIDNPKWSDPVYVRSYMRAYSMRNKDHLSMKSREWVRKNKEKRLDIQARYREANQGYLLQAARARRAKERIGAFTHSDWLIIKQMFDSRCLGCGKCEPDVRLEADHVISLKNGGSHEPQNIQPLCRTCNASKGAKNIDFRTERNLSKHGISVREI